MSVDNMSVCVYSPTLKKGGLYWIWVVRHSVRHLEETDRISPNVVYTLILTRSRLGLLHIIFCALVIELWPLINVRILFRISFLLNILRTE